MTPPANNAEKPSARPYILLAILILVLIATTLVGRIYYHQQRAKLRDTAAEQLRAIADLKADQLRHWRNERLGDARQIQETPFVHQTVARYFANEDPETQAELLAWMKTIRDNNGYARVVLVDKDLTPRLAIPEDQAWIGKQSELKIQEAWRTGQIIESDLHQSEVSGHINMDILAPISGTNLLAAIVLEINPQEFLFPLFQTWPTPSPSAETLLVRREGNQVLFLNELRHRKNTALALRLPASNPRLPAALAVSGGEGLVEGNDYRDVPVLADIRSIPGTSWFLIAKMDQKEVYAPMWQWIQTAVALILTAALAVFLLWQRRILESTRQREEKVRRAEEALLREQRLLNNLMSTIPDHIYFKDREGRFLRVNDALAHAQRFATPKDAIGKTDFDVFTEEHAQQAYDDEQRVITTGESILGKEEKETWPDGHVTWASTTKIPLRNETGEIIGLIGISRDITQHRELEDQLRQSQKMQAIGQLAGGVAHDFNNMLTAIIGYAAVALQRLPAHDPLRSTIEEISRAADRSAGLTRQLLAFSRRQTLQPRQLNLNEVIADMKKMLVRLIGEQVELHTRLAPILENIQADRTQIEQVIMNLVLNARDAMAGQTRPSSLTIETANAILDETYTRRFPDLAPGDYVMISVNDNGTGMTPAVKARIFEPFFTTKETGKGLGLGLATCYGIIKQSGGHIAAYSELGIGTTFKVYLPRANKAPVLAAPTASPTEKTNRGNESILLVEDEEIVRELFVLVLRDLGYTVFEAGNGVQALQLLRQLDGQAPKLLVTDVVMPEMDGRQLAEQVRRLYPDMKIIFVSGYSEEVITKQGVLDPGIVLVQKPCTPAALAGKVREVLDR